MSPFRNWVLSDVDRDRLHRELFETTGYCVVRRFCSQSETEDVRRFWHRHPMAVGEKGYWANRPNYALNRGGFVQRYECFFWNPPEHPLTYEIAWSAHLLRNFVSGTPFHASFLPLDGFATSYRPTRTDAGDRGVVAHNDRFSPDQTHLIQVSLALSTIGRDYEGGGTRFCRYDGSEVNVHEIERLEAGDLLLFNQANDHSVDPVTASNPDDPLAGHWRLLMPDHRIQQDAVDSAAQRDAVLVPRRVLDAYDRPSVRDLCRVAFRLVTKRGRP